MIAPEVIAELKKAGIRYEINFGLRESVSFRLDATAALAIFPDSMSLFAKARWLLAEHDVQTVILGNGSNLFFGCSYFDGAVLFTKGMNRMEVMEDTIVCDCGASLTALSLMAQRGGLAGLEFAYGIPGTVGGAVCMNAGAYGSSVSDVLAESTAFDTESGKIYRIEDHLFGYRKSIYIENKNLVCLRATFRLQPGYPEAIGETMRANKEARRQKQPLEYPSAGSYFKRPEGSFAGKLIEDCGLKGLRIGGAAVSEKHAGFLINCQNASFSDVLALEEEVRRRVKERFGVSLEREVVVIENQSREKNGKKE